LPPCAQNAQGKICRSGRAVNVVNANQLIRIFSRETKNGQILFPVYGKNS
jgi:hypothetical protein